MIPKKIHYCWLSTEEFPIIVKKCFESWVKNLKEYEFILWDYNKVKDENLLDVIWVKESLEVKKYAFVSDYVRVYALYKYGGIYLDTDVEVLKSFNDILQNEIFLGYESNNIDIEAAVIGSKKGNKFIESVLNYYLRRKFIKNDCSYDELPLPRIFNNIIQNHKYINVYSSSYFSPKNIHTDKVKATINTYTIHHFGGSWVEKGFKTKIKRILHKIFIYFRLHTFIIKCIRLIRGYKK